MIAQIIRNLTIRLFTNNRMERCNMARKKTFEEFVIELQEKNPNIQLLSDYYINSRTKLLFKCKVCGHEWETIPNTLLLGHGCPSCGTEIAKKKTTKTNQQFIEELKWIDNTIIPLGSYHNAHSYMKFRCSKCGNQWEAKPYMVLQNHGCPVCAHKAGGQKQSYNNKEFLLKVKEIMPNIEILGEYKRSNIKVTCRCRFCGYSWEATPNNILQGQTGCSKCNRVYQTSFPEQAIFYYIIKVYPDAINGYREGFKNSEIDVFIPSLKLGIEYDGRFFHTEKTINKEKRKYNICKKLGIKLIRIRFDLQSDISDKTILSHLVKPNKEYEELNRVINQLFIEIGGTKPQINVEDDKNDILALYMKVKTEKSLSYNYPEIAKEWHSTKNGSILPSMVSAGTRAKFWWQCSTCGYEWETTVLSRTGKTHSRCPKCSHHLTRSNDEFLDELARINPTIQPLEHFKNMEWKICCRCSVCNNEWKVEPIKLLNKRGCPKCAITNRCLSNEDVQKKIDKVRDNIKVIKYTGLNYQGEFFCNRCGMSFSALSKSVIQGHYNCPNCSKTRKLSNKEFLNRLRSINPFIIPLEDYQNMITKIQVRCLVCGHEWLVKPKSLIHSKTGCPSCYSKRNDN